MGDHLISCSLYLFPLKWQSLFFIPSPPDKDIAKIISWKMTWSELHFRISSYNSPCLSQAVFVNVTLEIFWRQAGAPRRTGVHGRTRSTHVHIHTQTRTHARALQTGLECGSWLGRSRFLAAAGVSCVRLPIFIVFVCGVFPSTRGCARGRSGSFLVKYSSFHTDPQVSGPHGPDECLTGVQRRGVGLRPAAEPEWPW